MEPVEPDRRLAGRYVLVEAIATGGMASVWKARDLVLARTVAVKILRQDLTDKAEVAERFHREAVAAAALSHPHIISVFDTGSEDGVLFIVMEHFAGRPLWEDLAGTGTVEPSRAAAMLLPVLDALGFAHQHGVVHRDVKPANILVDREGWVKVADFGIAKAAFHAEDLTATGALLGTVRYVAPEQVQGSPVDGRADLYSLGVVLYEGLTGRPPFHAGNEVATAMLRLTQQPLAPRRISPGIPKGMEDVVMRAMALDPDDRFPSAEAMRAALERFATDETDTIRSAPTRAIAPPVRRDDDQPSARRSSVFRSWMLVPLVLLVVAGAAVATGMLQLGGPLGVRPAPDQSSTAAGAPIPIVSASDFDPEGSPPSEHPETVGSAIDGNPATAWTTDHYDTADFGRLKDGLGLWVGFEVDAEVTRVVIRSAIPGWSFELKAGRIPNDLSAPLAAEDGRTTFRADPSGRTVVVLRPVSAPGILIWITGLGPDQGRFAAAIAEVSVQGSAS